ncbi:MAG TPA: hypothetical protein VK968_14625 [Roseimicrobium sp.]|nr:hypothetical protein [Roseimicrobium sp.]
MKTIHLLTLTLSLCTVAVIAQDAGKPSPEGPRGQGRRPMMPIITALDANKDGVIDATEIANAAAALKTLDKNGDGQLTVDEIMPPRSEGGRGAGVPEGRARPAAE